MSRRPTAIKLRTQTRFEIAWSVPRQRFMRPDSHETPWWEDGRFPSEHLARRRFRDLVECLAPVDGEVALYIVSFLKDEERLVEKVTEYSGARTAPPRRTVLPMTLEIRKALAELEETWSKRKALIDIPPPRSRGTHRPRRHGKSFAWAYWLSGATALAGIVAMMMTKQPAPLSSVAKTPSAESFTSYGVVREESSGTCEKITLDNRSGRVTGIEHGTCQSLRTQNEEPASDPIAERLSAFRNRRN